MGWLDFFFTTPNREKFAQFVMAELRKVGNGGEMKFDEERFIIERGKDGFINLANLYHEYCQTPRRDRNKVLDRFIRGCLGTTAFELPRDFNDVHPDLLPVVRSRFYLESVTLQSRARGGDEVAVPQHTIGDHLALSLVYDLPQAMRSIIQDDLDKWEVSFYEAVEAAKRNLEQVGNISFASLQADGGDGVFISATGDNYDASRLMILDLVRKMPVRGDYIAMVPNRDTLIITGSEDLTGLKMMWTLAEESFQKPRPISTVALRLVGDEWESWLPAADSPAYPKFHELRLRTVGMECNDQKELLDQVHEQRGQNLFVASFSAVKHRDTGRISSYSVWSQGVETLLPETDDLVLLWPDATTEKVKLAAAGSFQRVYEVVGDLMRPLGTYPERYRVSDFPSESQLAMIGRGDWPEP